MAARVCERRRACRALDKKVTYSSITKSVFDVPEDTKQHKESLYTQGGGDEEEESKDTL